MKKYRFEQFAATRLYTGAIAYSPDGQQIAHVNNVTGQFNLWTVPSGGGMPRQLTSYSDNTVRAIAWRPDGQQLLFLADQNGDEQHQVYAIGAQGGWPEPLTNKMDAQHFLSADAYSPDGQTIAYAGNDVNPMNMEVILRNAATGETRRPFPAGGAMYIPVAWSPNGRYLTALKQVSNTEMDILLLDTQTSAIVNTTEHDGDMIFVPGPWAKDSSGFYIATNSGREFVGLAFYKIADQKWEWVETPDHDLENITLSKDGRVLLWIINEDGASKLYGRDLQTGKPLPLPTLPIGQADAIDVNPDGTRAALIFTSAAEAGNLYEIDLQTGEMIALGQSMIGGVDPADMVIPELIHYKTHDGRDIPAWLYRPKGDSGDGSGKFPVILSIHGGPEAQERPRYMYNGLYQYLLNRGFGILAPNIRGSTGYGISYQKLIHRDWGGAELKDIEHAAKYLQALDWVDNNRIAVFGGSFGGFATLSAATRLPDYWAAAVDLVGPSNLLTFVNSVPPHWRSMMRNWVGDAEDDHDLLVERSPITYVDQIKAPMLVIQGAKDPRVNKAESDQMVERIRKNGGDVRYYVDENEGHGATRRENAIKWYRMVSEYLEEYLLDEPAAESVAKGFS
ncbi:MAG TPA: S9 family peptidase [Phototrophicaceae bacterium]|nr:S9 family peptidase [Phototrophicaceae bacterium]